MDELKLDPSVIIREYKEDNAEFAFELGSATKWYLFKAESDNEMNVSIPLK
jgi:hypothetical protein